MANVIIASGSTTLGLAGDGAISNSIDVSGYSQIALAGTAIDSNGNESSAVNNLFILTDIDLDGFTINQEIGQVDAGQVGEAANVRIVTAPPPSVQVKVWSTVNVTDYTVVWALWGDDGTTV